MDLVLGGVLLRPVESAVSAVLGGGAVDLLRPGTALVRTRGKRQSYFSPCPSSARCASTRRRLRPICCRQPERYLTPIGALLRKTSLDELPQLVSVCRGDLSLVGPRPALFNQDDLVALRTRRGVHRLVPGITGWAQVNGRDELAIPVKVGYDAEYMAAQSLGVDLKILLLTLWRVLRAEGVQH